VVNGARAEHAFPEFIACKGHLSPDTIDVRLPDYSRRVGLSARAGEVMSRRFGGRVGCRDRGFLSADQKFRDRNPIVTPTEGNQTARGGARPGAGRPKGSKGLADTSRPWIAWASACWRSRPASARARWSRCCC
jgi:hypothetical protein